MLMTVLKMLTFVTKNYLLTECLKIHRILKHVTDSYLNFKIMQQKIINIKNCDIFKY